MINPKTVNIYDFDECLIRTPGYQVHTNPNDHIYTWFDSPMSLDIEKYNIYCVGNVMNDIKERKAKGEPVCLVSQRVEELRPDILKIFGVFGIEVDEIHLLGRKQEKGLIMRELVEKHQAGCVRVFDDSLAELHSYSTYRKKDFTHTPWGDLFIEFYYVDHSKVLRINDPEIYHADRIIVVTKDNQKVVS